jgi:hypothetical protein
MKILSPYMVQRNNDGAEPFAEFAVESIDHVQIPEEQKATPAQETKELTGAEEQAAAEAAKVAAEQAKANEGKTPEQIAAEATAAAAAASTEDGTVEKTEFDITDLEGETIFNPATPEDESANWKEVGSMLEIEVPEDTPEAFQSAYQAKIEAERKKAVAEYLIEEKGFKPEQIKTIEAFRNGATELSIHSVEKPYRDYLTLNPEEKIKGYLIAMNYTEEAAQRQVDQHIELGTMDDEVARINASVEARMRGAVNEHFETLKAEAEAAKAARVAAIEKENKLVIEALKARTEYMGLALKPELVNKLVEKWNNGTYRQAMESDVNAVVDFIFERELGKKARELVVTGKNREFRQQIQGKLQNLDAAKAAAAQSSGGVSTAARSAQSDDEPFTGWENINQVNVGHS